MKIPQDSVTFLADHSHDFHEQMKFTAITEATTFALKQNYRSICIYACLHNTQCFLVPSFRRKLKWRHKACHRTAAAGPSLLGGERAWYEMQALEEPWPVGKSWRRLWLDHGLTVWQRCAQVWPRAAKCKDRGTEDYDKPSLPRNPCGKGCVCLS